MFWRNLSRTVLKLPRGINEDCPEAPTADSG
jgi:hypothetical protein